MDYVIVPSHFSRRHYWLIAEIAFSSRATDLHTKRDDYTRYGVREYLVVCLREQQLRWFDVRANQELPFERGDIVRVQTFPGLWIRREALFAKDYRLLMATPKQPSRVWPRPNMRHLRRSLCKPAARRRSSEPGCTDASALRASQTKYQVALLLRISNRVALPVVVYAVRTD